MEKFKPHVILVLPLRNGGRIKRARENKMRKPSKIKAKRLWVMFVGLSRSD